MTMAQGIFNESSLARVWEHTKDRNTGIILAPDEAALKHDIRKNDFGGFGFIPVERHIVGSDDIEYAFIVIGNAGDDHGCLKGFLCKYGAKYVQERVILKPHDSAHAWLHHLGEYAVEDIGEWHPERMDYYLTRLNPSFVFVEKIIFIRSLTFMTAMGKARGLPIVKEF